MEKLKHFWHSHPLGLKEIQMDEGGHKLVICGLCEKQILGPAYSCSECDFFLHKRCAELRRQVTDPIHQHPMHLSWRLACDFCGDDEKKMLLCSIHVKCSSTSSSTPLRDLESEIMDQKDHDLDVLHLPMNCFVEHLLLEKIEDEPMISHWSHEHQLTLFKVQNDNETNNDNTILCDSCVQPISHPFYCCTQCVYFLHLNCANLPPEIQHPLHQHPIQLSNFSEFYRLTGCEACESYNNGFFYKCDTCKSFAIDVKCALLPASIVHEAHKHSLCQRNNTWMRMDIAVHVDSIFIITGSDVRIAISVYAVIVLYSLKPSSIDGIDIPSSLPILLSLIIPKISIVKFARKK
ncbi:unnamed protein product [Ilex paraguariensis]|uniref:Phorbol-ester/DAG-type domain-containing protein n=1 Tax=Ilex paraguariensis TaxID=185542 RepID=A0ABC8TEN2_9AQUA